MSNAVKTQLATKTPLVSVIIPMYNTEEYISECIESVLNQSFPNIEIIVIDDGSTDKSLSEAQKYESERVHIFQQNHMGAQRARNWGFELSHGDYIQFLDSDDLLSKGKIKAQVDLLANENKDAIATCPILTYESGTLQEWWMETYHNYDSGFDLLVDLWLHFAPSWPHHAYLTPRELVENSGGWDENLEKNQDGDLFSRVLTRCKKVCFVSDETAVWRIRLDSTCHKNSSNKIESVFRSYSKISELLLSIEDSQRVRKAIAIAYGSFIINDSDRHYANQALDCLKKLNIKPDYRIRARHFVLLSKFLHPQTAFKWYKVIQKIRGKRVCFS